MLELKDFDASLPEYRLWEEDKNSTLIHYYPAKKKGCRGAVIIFPGGGYVSRAVHEGLGYAEYLTENGINAFVVDYRVKPEVFPAPLCDARRAVRFVRYYAEKFGIDPSLVSVMGSSAGGHLAALVSTYRNEIAGEGVDEIDKETYIPNAQILCYPVISTVDDTIWHRGSGLNLLGEDNLDFAPNVSPDLIADEKTPQAFIWHTAEDRSVNVINSYAYASTLRRKNVPVEMHIFPDGGHGLGLGHGNKNADTFPKKLQDHLSQWNGLLISYLKYIGHIE
ncbi:MAG: alpha/beta hydrolase [Ruminococcaceae bacterium]|nr:alpha/beta hydrolase [Oscillospiraceae bacterium]